jgi:hypothetical protein
VRKIAVIQPIQPWWKAKGSLTVNQSSKKRLTTNIEESSSSALQ